MSDGAKVGFIFGLWIGFLLCATGVQLGIINL